MVKRAGRKAKARVMHIGKKGGRYYIAKGKKVYPGKKRKVRVKKTVRR